MNLSNLHPTDLLQRVLTVSRNSVVVLKAVYDPEGLLTDLRLTMLNALAERDLGRSFADVQGQSASQLFPHLADPAIMNRYRQVMETGDSDHFEWECRQVGQPMLSWFDVSVARLTNCLLLSYIDITHIKTFADVSKVKRTQLVTSQAELLSSVLDGSQNSITAFDAVRDAGGNIADFRYVLQNEANRQRIGRSDEQVIGRTMLEVFPLKKEKGLLDLYAKVVNTGLSLRTEIDFDFGHGTGWYDLSVVKRGDGVVLTVLDKTLEKQAEHNFQKQAELLQTISDNTPVGLVLWDAVRDNTPERTLIDFCYRMSNPMNTYVTGYAPETLIGQQLLTLFPRFRGTEMELALRDVIETGESNRMIFTYYTDSSDAWFDAQFSRVGTDAVLMTFVDITEQHKVQLDQIKKANLMQTVINAQPSGIVLFDPVREVSTSGLPGRVVDFTYALVNETQLRTTGKSARDVIGNTVSGLFPSSEGHQLLELMVEVAESGEPKEWLLPFFSDGIEGWFQASLVWHNEQILFTFLDVSRLKEQQHALEMANLELRRSNDNLQQFATIASHDLQEPLRKIQSFGSILATNAELDESSQDMIARMQKAAQRMSELIRDLLDYSRVSTRRAPFEAVPLTKLITDIRDTLFVAIEESGGRIDYGELPVVYGDKTQLEQLFQNLLSNAIKFRRSGVVPYVQITSRCLSITNLPDLVAGQVRAATRSDSSTSRLFHEINITDNGIGFEEKYLDRIFQVFQRLHSKSHYPGTGVGLAICRKVIENHGGVLTASSQPDIGTTFSVYIPAIEG
ncbi:PAS domain-containing sensor histidine kinase [Spirosoma pollinicola]|uniref:histidine kinase n=1 Tax=Spirosoma pollinicola TaxID=2057025 RepID=A0A2K8Z0A8_9BACT|nr:PAS domain-containing protein [Spirosoma pollinicola]AUD03317.1 hypothetical protein CWM47_16635 [Spirosoma pollinicola]